MQNLTKKKTQILKIKPSKNKKFKDLIREIKIELDGKREIMYMDIINFIIRNQLIGERYNHIIIWCNHKIKSVCILLSFNTNF